MIRNLGDKTPLIHPTAFVSESAYVLGDVEIGEGSSIWPGVVIRGDMGKITIGKDTCVEDNSVVHGDADVDIGDRVVIGHNVLCHARTVGDRVLIGSGATVNDGVTIGDDSLVASGAMVVENMTIPGGSFVVGLPARVKGAISERHKEMIAYTVDVYAEKAQRYKSQGDLESPRDE
jgi:carbonic anhydrase/acetyltransferase-like protein (isoleucine patch superfamily)